jgi:hypothetical protein
MRLSTYRLPLFVIAILLVAGLVSAQTGKIGGKVADQQGGVLPGATVVVRNVNTGLSLTQVTNAAGAYNFPSLDPGTYRVEVSLPGFNSYARDGLILTTGQSITVDAALEVAGVSETVTVTGESPMLNTRESKVGGVVENEQIENVPINSRDTQQLALLVPGARPAERFDPTKSRVPAISFGTNSAGRSILYTLDGGDNTDDAVGGLLQQISMDAVQEFEVVTSRIKAEYGRAGGGAVQIVTKSGTNDYKGSVFEFFRDKSLNATTQPEKDAGIDKAPFRRHQFGGVLGGPIVQDKAFFFVNYERVVEDVNSVLSLAPEVQGAYSQEFLSSHGGLGAIDQPFRRNYFLGKYTQQFNPANRLDVRYSYEDNGREGDQVGTGFTANATFDQAATQTNDLQSVLGRFQTIVGSSGFNELVVSWSDFENVIQGVTQSDFVTPGTPTLQYPSLRAGQNTNAPQRTFQTKVDFRDTFSYSLDTHEIKFGGNVARVDPFGAHIPFSSQGTFTYANDGDPEDQAIFFTMFDIIPIIDRPNTDVGFFAQDDWRVSSNLTLNLGVRYDVEYGTLSDIEYGTNGRFLIDDPRSPYFGQGTPEDDKNNIAPRVGFAWDVQSDGKTVVRGGWGLFYDKIVYNASIFTDIDFVGVRGAALDGNDFPGGIIPFGPDNIPTFDDLFATFGFPQPFEPIVAPGYEFAKSSQFTIGVSRQLDPTLALDVDYIHSEGSQRGKQSDLNERVVPFDNNSRLFFPELRGRLRIAESIGEDTYDGLQMSLRKRFSNSMQFVANYTLSQIEGNAESNFGTEAECRACIGSDRDIGPYTNDATHRVVLSGIFQLPADFQVSALYQGESGRALTSFSNQDLNGNGRLSTTTPPTHPLDMTDGPNGEAPGRGNFRGEPTHTVDLRVAKFFRFGERNLQVMLEAFNLFNRVNWGNRVNEVFGSAGFGQPTGELNIDQLQIQLGVRFTF